MLPPSPKKVFIALGMVLLFGTLLRIVTAPARERGRICARRVLVLDSSTEVLMAASKYFTNPRFDIDQSWEPGNFPESEFKRRYESLFGILLLISETKGLDLSVTMIKPNFSEPLIPSEVGE